MSTTSTFLELCPDHAFDDLDFLPVLASMPPDQTVFEYLVGCWRRQQGARNVLHKKVHGVQTSSSGNV